MNSGKSAKIAKTLLILYVYVAIYTYKYVRLYFTSQTTFVATM